MKKIICILICLSFYVGLFSQSFSVEDPHFTLDVSKSDEFNDGILDNYKWKKLTGRYWGIGLFDEDLVVVENGCLNLKANRRNNTYYTGGIVPRKFPITPEYHFGYYEIYAKLPKGALGFWPTFWLHAGSRETWYEEIDIMDKHGHLPSTATNIAIYDYSREDPIIYLKDYFSLPDLAAGFHKISLLWLPGSVRYYIDNLKIGEYKASDVPFHSLFVFMDLQIGEINKQVPLIPDAILSQEKYMIDYFRYYPMAFDCTEVTVNSAHPFPTDPQNKSFYKFRKGYKISDITINTKQKIYLRAETVELGSNFEILSGSELIIETGQCNCP